MTGPDDNASGVPQSSLIGPRRRDKDDVVFDALGAVDEAQVAVGLARAALRPQDGDSSSPLLSNLLTDLEQIQRMLVTAGGTLAVDVDGVPPPGMPIVERADVEHLADVERRWRDAVHLDGRFYLSGGTAAGAALDWARVVARRSERMVVRLLRRRRRSEYDTVAEYLNGLSRVLFFAARWADQPTG